MGMILVTGAGGFLGGYVCRALSAHGHEVVATDRAFASPSPCREEQGDVTDTGFVAGLLHTCSFTAVVHLAAMRNSASQQQPDESMRVNIGGSLGLLQAARRAGVSRFIFGSSISAYGPKPFAQYGEVSEAEPAAPDNVYGVGKRYVEVAGEQVRRQSGMAFVALRIAMVVGAGVTSTASQWRGEIFEKLRAVQHTPIHLPYAEHEILPLIHVTDVAEITRRIVEAERARHVIYNTPCENVTCGDLAEAVRTLNPNVELVLDGSGTRSDPEAIDGRRCAEEFGFRPLPVKERLRLAFESGEP